MPTDVGWGAAMVILPQTAEYGSSGFGDPVAVVETAGDGGTVDETMGPLLGVSDAGTGNSGITIPNMVREAIDRPIFPGTFSEIPNAFVRANGEGMSVSFPLQGNGITSDVAPGEARPLNGPDAIYQASGLSGSASGTSWKYVPSATTIYATIRLFIGDQTNGLAYTYQDCLVETLDIPNEGGESTIVNASLSLGSIINVVELGMPTSFGYGTQATLSPPIDQDSTFTWGTDRCHQTFTVNIANTVEEFSCSNAANGKRLDQSGRRISANGSVYLDADAADLRFEWLELIDEDGSLASATWDYGDSSSVRNSVLFACNTLQVTNLSYDRAGSLTTAEIESHCTTLTGSADEFSLTFD